MIASMIVAGVFMIGGVVVYFDDHHLSGTFSLSLAPYLGRALEG